MSSGKNDAGSIKHNKKIIRGEITMSEKMKAFLEALSKDKDLLDKLNAIPFETEEEKITVAIAFAKDELGIELTEDDFKKPEVVNGELNDDELEAVAGGDSCVCVAGGYGGGGGKFDDRYDEFSDLHHYNEYTCVCVLGGGGEYVHAGKKYERCICVVGGTGYAAHYEYYLNDM